MVRGTRRSERDQGLRSWSVRVAGSFTIASPSCPRPFPRSPRACDLDAPYRNIACAVDGSRASSRALDEAGRLRALGPGRLSVVHCLVPGAPALLAGGRRPGAGERAAAARWLEGEAQRVGATPVLLEGLHAGEAVCAWARDAGCDLLVAASHRGLLARAVLGSFAAYAAYNAPCSVLLVRPAPVGRTGGEAEAARREVRASALRPAPLGSEAPLEELVEEVRPLRATDRLADAAARVAEAGCGLPVVDAGGRLVGYLSERDILRAVLSPYLQVLGETGFLTYDLLSLVRRVREVASSAVGEHMSRDLPAVPVDASVMHLVEQMLHHGLASAPAIDADGRLAGVLRGMSVVLDLFRRAGAPADAPAEAAEPGG